MVNICPQRLYNLVSFLDEILVANSYSIHYQPIGTQCPTPRKPEIKWMVSHQNPLILLVTVCTSFSCLCGNLWTNAQRFINNFVWKITRHVDNFVKIADKTIRKICGNAAFPASHWPILFSASYLSTLKAFIFIAFCALCFYAG